MAMDDRTPALGPESLSLGGVLKYLRVSREEIASRVGVSTDSLNNWCSGRTQIKLQHLSRLVQVLRDSGAPRDLLYSLLTAELVRQGMSEDVMRFFDVADQKVDGMPIFVLGSHLNSGFYESVVLGVHDAMQALGVDDVVYLDTCGREEVFQYYLTVTLESPTRGVILVGMRFQERHLHKLSSLASRLSIRGIPSVFISGSPPALPERSATVTVDSYGAAAKATELLWARGHRHIVAVGIAHWLGQRERVKGYQDTMEQLGGCPTVVWALTQDSGPQPATFGDRLDLREASEFIAANEEIEAILVLSSTGVKEVMRALHSRGRVAGQDVALMALGCWDWMHNIARPPISHIVVPYYEAGKQAAHLLVALGDHDLSVKQRNVVIPLPNQTLHGGENGTMDTARSLATALRNLQRRAEWPGNTTHVAT